MSPTPEWVEADEDDDTRVRSTFDRADNTARLALEVADLKRQLASLAAERDEARARVTRAEEDANRAIDRRRDVQAEHRKAGETWDRQRERLTAEVRDLRAKVAAVDARVGDLAAFWTGQAQEAKAANCDLWASILQAHADQVAALASVGRTEPEGADDRAAAEPVRSAAPRYATDHGFTPSVGNPFANPDDCKVMLARRVCPYTREEHDPALPPVDIDAFGYRRGRFTAPAPAPEAGGEDRG